MNQPWTARELQTEIEFEQARSGVNLLLQAQLQSEPRNLRPHPYIDPMAVEILEGSTPKAYLFLDRYKILGFRTGLVSTSRSPTLLAREGDREQALRTAAAFLMGLTGIRKIKLIFPQSDRPTLQEITRELPEKDRWSVVPNDYPDAILSLPAGFEMFLQQAGYKLRRNIRHYLKVSEKQNWNFIPRMEGGLFQGGAEHLAEISKFSHPRHRTLA